MYCSTDMKRNCCLLAALSFALIASCSNQTPPPEDHAGDSHGAVVHDEYVYERAPFPSAHASTVVEMPQGLAAAWFGGTEEGASDVGIWFSRLLETGWTVPEEIATGEQEDGSRYPCWNPVLYQAPGGPLVCFYKIGPSPRAWWGMVRVSSDFGQSWSDEVRLPDGILGPIRAKPVSLEDGSLLAGSSTENDGWVVHMERYTAAEDQEDMWSLTRLVSPDSWQKSGPLNDPDVFEAIQPTILVHDPDTIQILCRSRQDVITESWSYDRGATWTDMAATVLPNPSAGIDAVRLTDGRFLLVYNPLTEGRQELAVALSDDGRHWQHVLHLEDAEGEYSYPAVIQAEDGHVHVTYTWKRERIKHVILDPLRIGEQPG